MTNVKHERHRGRTRISSKHQVTIPVEALRGAGLHPSDELSVVAAGAGRIVLERTESNILPFAGCLPNVYPATYLEELRDEWRS